MIAKEKFLDYESIRKSGVTNMFDLTTVLTLSRADLTRTDLADIMENYSKYKLEYL